MEIVNAIFRREEGSPAKLSDADLPSHRTATRLHSPEQAIFLARNVVDRIQSYRDAFVRHGVDGPAADLLVDCAGNPRVIGATYRAIKESLPEVINLEALTLLVRSAEGNPQNVRDIVSRYKKIEASLGIDLDSFGGLSTEERERVVADICLGMTCLGNKDSEMSVAPQKAYDMLINMYGRYRDVGMSPLVSANMLKFYSEPAVCTSTPKQLHDRLAYIESCISPRAMEDNVYSAANIFFQSHYAQMPLDRVLTQFTAREEALRQNEDYLPGNARACLFVCLTAEMMAAASPYSLAEAMQRTCALYHVLRSEGKSSALASTMVQASISYAPPQADDASPTNDPIDRMEEERRRILEGALD
ncbi:MAG: hypothetical protein RH917_20545 [Lacipirellulaceae bacterium]